MPGTVLYIDDQPELPGRVGELLVQAGYELVHTADPEEALRIVRDGRPALVLMEVLLSGCDGFDLMRKVDRAAGARPLPVVVVTRGERTSQLYGQALELGAEDFLCKPVVGAEILEAVMEFARNDRQEPSAAAVTEPAVEFFEGDLMEQPLARLLGRLHRAGASGVLRLRPGPDVRAVQLRNGSPVEVEKHRNIESVADYLLRTFRIDAEQYEMLVDQLMARIAGPREILIGMKALTEEQLAAATHEQARGVFLEMFAWSSGRFSFHPDQRLDLSNALELNCSPGKILRAGLKQTTDALIRDALDRRAHLYASFSEDAPDRLDDLELSPNERSHVESLMGDRTIAEVLTAETLGRRTLYELYALGALQLDENPVFVLDQVLKPDEPDEFESLEDVDTPIRQLPRQQSRMQRAPDREDPGDIESEIDEIARRLESQNDFELFGIDETSSDANVRAAYDRLLRSLRQDRDPSESEESGTRARDLGKRLEQAYQRVRNADTRRAFAGLRKKRREDQQEPETGSRAVDAERWFRTGEGYLRHEEFAQAVEAFGMAVHLDPEQGDYAAYLGFALYRSNPDDSVIRREALEHIAKGVKIAPDREKPLLFLSRIFRETGDTAMAAKVLRRALRVNPDSPALAQEMCMIDTAGSRSKGKKLLDRFLRR